ELTGGIGVDNAFDAVGSTVAINTCVESTRNGGTTVLVGAGGLDQELNVSPPVLMTINERKIMGSCLGGCNGRRDIPRLVALWQADPALEARERGAEAEVQSIAEAERDVRVAVDVETIDIFVLALVTVAGRGEQQHS